MGDRGERLVVVGEVVGLFGVAGWVKVYSYTDPPENLLAYEGWHLAGDGDWRPAELEGGQRHGKGLVAKLRGVDDRERARTLLGTTIAVPRRALPEPEPGRYYWVDLEGLAVRTVEGTPLGHVTHLLATGANDVLVVRGERERLIPFVLEDVVRRVDLEAGEIEVDWDPEF